MGIIDARMQLQEITTDWVGELPLLGRRFSVINEGSLGRGYFEV